MPGLQRGLSIFALFDNETPSLSLSEIARRLKLSRSTVFRLLYTLEQFGYLAKTRNTGEFSLAANVLSLGFNFLCQLPITQIAQPVLKTIAEQAQAAAHLVILDRHETVHVARVTPVAPLVSNLQIGTRRPVHAVASGRMLLAHKPEEELIGLYQLIRDNSSSIAPPSSLKTFLATATADRNRGYAYSRTAFEPGLMSCASAVLNHVGEAVAAITVVGPMEHMDAELGEKVIATLVCKAASMLSVQLGYQVAKPGR